MRQNNFIAIVGRDPCHGLHSLVKRDPIVTGALISAGAGLFGNLLGASSQKSANEANMRIAQYNAQQQRLQNEQNYWYTQQLQNSQNAFSERMANEARDYNEQYNDPKAVVKRLQAAGINPASAFGQPYQANVSGIQSASPTFNGNAPQLNTRVEPYFPDLSPISNAANAYFQNELLNKQVQSSDVDTQIKKVELRFKVASELSKLYESKARIENTIQNTKKGSAEFDKLQSEKSEIDNRIRLFNETFDDLKKREKLQNDIMSEQKTNIIADTAKKRADTWLTQLNAEWFPKMSDAQLSMLKEQEFNVIQQTALLVEQKRLTTKQAIEQHLKNGLLGLEFNDQSVKHGIKNGKNQATKTLYYFADYMSSLLLGNLKLFGK